MVVLRINVSNSYFDNHEMEGRKVDYVPKITTKYKMINSNASTRLNSLILPRESYIIG